LYGGTHSTDAKIRPSGEPYAFVNPNPTPAPARKEGSTL
jgi:hypothetical protein